MAKGVPFAVAILALFGSQLKPTNGDQSATVSVNSLQQFHDMDLTLASCHNVKVARRNNSNVSYRTSLTDQNHANLSQFAINILTHDI